MKIKNYTQKNPLVTPHLAKTHNVKSQHKKPQSVGKS